jgi:hypothetical protein
MGVLSFVSTACSREYGPCGLLMTLALGLMKLSVWIEAAAGNNSVQQIQV